MVHSALITILKHFKRGAVGDQNCKNPLQEWMGILWTNTTEEITSCSTLFLVSMIHMEICRVSRENFVWLEPGSIVHTDAP